MALTWREVTAPNFSGVAESQRAAALALRDATGGLSDALGAFGKSRSDAADRDFLAQISRYTDPASLDQALKAGVATGAVSPDAIKFGMARQADLLGNVGTGLNNQSKALGNDQAAWANDRTRQLSDLSFEGATANAEDARTARADQLAAKELFAQIAPVSADPADMLRRARAANANPSVINNLVSLIETQGGALTGGPADPSSVVLDQSLSGLIDRTEGAGDYSTLYGHAQKEGGAFAGVDVSKKTIGELKQFASKDGEYGKAQIASLGKLATPMGRFQIVGQTLADTAKAMGLSDDTVFDANTQNAMFDYLAKARLQKADSMAGKMTELRKEWEGFKNVPDDQLTAAITAYERGDKSALTGVAQNAPADPAAAAIAQAAGRNQELLVKGTQLQTQAQQILERSTADAGFDQNLPMLADLMSSEDKDKSVSEIAAKLSQEIPDIPLDTMTSHIDSVMERNGVSADVAAGFIRNAVRDNGWFDRRGILNWDGNLGADRYVDLNKVSNEISRFYDPKGKMLKGTEEQLSVLRAKKDAETKLSDMSAKVETAKQEYFNAVARKKDRPGVDIEPAKARYEALLAQFELSVAAANGSRILTANTNSKGR